MIVAVIEIALVLVRLFGSCTIRWSQCWCSSRRWRRFRTLDAGIAKIIPAALYLPRLRICEATCLASCARAVISVGVGVKVEGRRIRAAADNCDTACVIVGGRGGFSAAGACPVLVLAVTLQVNVVARNAGTPFAIIVAGADPVLSICADRVLALVLVVGVGVVVEIVAAFFGRRQV